MSGLEQAMAAIRDARGIVLSTHCNPDGDGIGSQLALYHALKRAGKRVFMHNHDGVPRIYRFLPGANEIGEGSEFGAGDVDLIVSLDAGAKSRLGMPEEFFAGRRLVVIDHHASNQRFGDVNWVDVGACSTGAMACELIEGMGWPLTPDIATAVYVTVLTDTGGFRNAATSAEALELAARLVRAGARPWPVACAVYESRSMGAFRLLRACLDTLQLKDDGRSAWLHVDKAMYRDSGGDEQDTEGFIEYARALEGVVVAVFIRPDSGHDGWKVTFRSKALDDAGVDVGALAVSLGGGGHRHASGCTLKGELEEVRARVEQAVSDALQAVEGTR